MIFRGRLTGLRQFHANNDGIKFRFALLTDQGDLEVFADSYTTGSDPDKSRTVAGMTRRRLKILGLDLDKCSADEWVQVMTPGEDGWSHVLDGAECDLEQKIDSYGTKYDIMTTTGVDTAGSLSMFAALQAAKGPKAAVAPPVAPPAHTAPPAAPPPPSAPPPAAAAPAAPARPSMAAPAHPAAPRPVPGPRPLASAAPAPAGARPSPI
jgi:hypothetical protein